jgi:Tfp pilus assembly protein PilE
MEEVQGSSPCSSTKIAKSAVKLLFFDELDNIVYALFMNIIKNNESGFSAVEIVMVIVIVGLIGAVGYLVYQKGQNKTTSSTVPATSMSKTTNNTSAPADPYAGWKTYIMPREKASFMYPSDWQLNVQNDSNITNTDSFVLTSPKGTSLSIAAVDNAGFGGDESKIVGNDPISFIGKSAYIQYRSYINPDGTYNSSIDELSLSSSPDQHYSLVIANNNLTNAQSLGTETAFNINMNFADGLSLANIDAANTNTDTKDFKLILQSAKY